MNWKGSDSTEDEETARVLGRNVVNNYNSTLGEVLDLTAFVCLLSFSPIQ